MLVTNRAFSVYAAVVIVVLAAVGMGCSKKSEYERVVERELASGETHNDLFLGYSLGMPKQGFYDHSWDLNRQGLVMQGPQNLTVQYELDDQELPHEAKMFYYPDFHAEAIYQMRVRFLYDGWAPWNRELYADSLQQHVVDLFEEWYGDGFFERQGADGKPEFVKVDGNRRIVVLQIDDSNVGAVITDLHAEEELQQATQNAGVPR